MTDHGSRPEAIVVTVSTRAADGTRPDTVGPQLIARLEADGWTVEPEATVIADGEADLSRLLAELCGPGLSAHHHHRWHRADAHRPDTRGDIGHR